jgi:hypothetical protein
MAWYGLVNKQTGDLVSIGTESMFENRDPARLPAGVDRVDFGANQPDQATNLWNAATRTWTARPAPVLVDRIADIETRLAADADWSAVFNGLTNARKTQLRTGWQRVMTGVLGGRRFRDSSEGVEV